MKADRNLAGSAREEEAPSLLLMAEPLLVAAAGAANLCGLSPSGWRKLDRTGHVPRPLHVGRRCLWSVAVLREWRDLGCPSREEFEARGRFLQESGSALPDLGGHGRVGCTPRATRSTRASGRPA